MADLVITPANVVPGAGAKIDRAHVAGVAVLAGQVGYLDLADSKYKLADNNSPTLAVRGPTGIFLNGAAPNQPVAVHISGPLTIGAAVAIGSGYYLSANAGGICPVADLGSGQYPSLLGFATNATDINVAITSAGVAIP